MLWFSLLGHCNLNTCLSSSPMSGEHAGGRAGTGIQSLLFIIYYDIVHVYKPCPLHVVYKEHAWLYYNIIIIAGLLYYYKYIE